MVEYRNPVYNAHGTIDCEINHPTLGWIPFHATPDDVEQTGRELYDELKDRTDIAPYVPPPPVDLDELDLDAINAVLTEPGSVVRALGLLTFQEINKLRVKAALPQYTMDQFIAALKANMR